MKTTKLQNALIVLASISVVLLIFFVREIRVFLAYCGIVAVVLLFFAGLNILFDIKKPGEK